MNNPETDKIVNGANEILTAIRYMESIDTERACEESLAIVRRQRRFALRNSLLKIAACLSLPLAAATAVLAYIHFFPSESERYATVTSPVGAVIEYELPDRSKVWLNSGSTLSYPVKFSRKSRQVRLEGEAYFSVEANPDRPFFVRTSDDISVKVYGTRFVVSAYPDDAFISTTLESGAVDMEAGLGERKHSVQLQPGDRATFSKTTGIIEKTRVNTYDYTAWREGRLIFRNATLGQIFNSLEHKFGVRIIVNGSREHEERYRATFRNESLDRTLDCLSRIANFSWDSADDGHIEVRLR